MSFNNEKDANTAYNEAITIVRSENSYLPDDFSDKVCKKLDFKNRDRRENALRIS